MMQKFRTLLATSSLWGSCRTVMGSALEYRIANVERRVRDCGPDDKLQQREKHEESDIETADRRDDPSYRVEDGLDDRGQIIGPTSAQVRYPRKNGVDEQQQRVDVDYPADYLGQGAE